MNGVEWCSEICIRRRYSYHRECTKTNYKTPLHVGGEKAVPEMNFITTLATIYTKCLPAEFISAQFDGILSVLSRSRAEYAVQTYQICTYAIKRWTSSVHCSKRREFIFCGYALVAHTVWNLFCKHYLPNGIGSQYFFDKLNNCNPFFFQFFFEQIFVLGCSE